MGEYEYRVRFPGWFGVSQRANDLADAQRQVADFTLRESLGKPVIERRPVGEWEPVPEVEEVRS